MELTKTKFKRTEVGVIPEDWHCLSLNESCKLKHGFQFLENHFAKTGVPVVKIGNLIDNGGLDLTRLSHVDPSFISSHSNFLLSKGDVLMALTGGTLGKVAIVDSNQKLLQNYRVGNFIPNQGISKEYIYQILNSSYLKKAVKRLVNEAAQPNFGKQDFDKLYFPLPPTLSEQKAIATALSDVDEMIAKLEKLIEKKKAIKQGAMQQLLTPPHKGGKRLEGFSGDWVERRLGEIAKIKTGTRNNQDKTGEGLYPFFVRSQTIERINSYSFDCEAILVPGEGGIGSIFHYINGKFEVHQRVYKISDFSADTVGKYVFLQMQFSFGKHAMTNSVKATVDSLRLPTFEEFVLWMPNEVEEQNSISEVLDDMNSEIEKLENRLIKFQNLKQGMMQELLTGRTRLI